MSPATDETQGGASHIARLLQQGLDRYGEDDVEGAVGAWQKVLELDSGNAEARDYLESVGVLAPEVVNDGTGQSLVRELLANAQELIATRDFEVAFDLLSGASDSETPVIELEATLDLVRSQLVHCYRGEVGKLGAVPVVTADGASITGYNLPTEAGFMLSLVDGATPVQDMISLSGMDSFEALRLLRGLMEAGIVEVRT